MQPSPSIVVSRSIVIVPVGVNAGSAVVQATVAWSQTIVPPSAKRAFAKVQRTGAAEANNGSRSSSRQAAYAARRTRGMEQTDMVSP
ncbi:MAG TPA: hypothetical protein VLF18_22245 [Tahibacter sp.]|uniref:hypothetical protein n=1 Tax=Tahibacter sp. TaxID=2056211 RepID=UPI002C76D754|nr:hypothetical protein [Tahibacter sp.]HSX62915.1 hypothetical protein [Tahibacter sp.]